MKKRQKKHLFARTCRVLGRFLLALGAVLCVASAIFAFAPLVNPPKTEEADVVEETPANPYPVKLVKNPTTQNHSVAFILPSIIAVSIALFLLGISFRHYNRTIRNVIARIAKFSHLSISTTELTLSTLIWAIVNIIIFTTTPLFAILTFTAMIMNNLLFIFAWTAYGCPVYTI